VPGYGPVIGFWGTLADVHHTAELALAVEGRMAPWTSFGAGSPQVGGELLAQPPAGLHIQGTGRSSRQTPTAPAGRGTSVVATRRSARVTSAAPKRLPPAISAAPNRQAWAAWDAEPAATPPHRRPSPGSHCGHRSPGPHARSSTAPAPGAQRWPATTHQLPGPGRSLHVPPATTATPTGSALLSVDATHPHAAGLSYAGDQQSGRSPAPATSAPTTPRSPPARAQSASSPQQSSPSVERKLDQDRCVHPLRPSAVTGAARLLRQLRNRERESRGVLPSWEVLPTQTIRPGSALEPVRLVAPARNGCGARSGRAPIACAQRHCSGAVRCCNCATTAPSWSGLGHFATRKRR
jgi:hypothetical protein